MVISARGCNWDLSRRTHLMGILNITPDSFSDGGKYFNYEDAVKRGLEMFSRGADIIDVGGESTRPGAEPLSEEEELRRVLPVVEKLAGEGIPVSIDTYKSDVARAALKAGALMVNDISGLKFDPEVAQCAAEYDALLVLMHIQGKPRDMQDNPHYTDLIGEISENLRQAAETAQNAGVKREKIIIDPGIGFGKRIQHNFEIIRKLSEFKSLGYPLMVGPSRKSFIGAIFNLPPEERLFGTCGACALAAANGADILRVHDPEEISQVVEVVDVICEKRTFVER